VNSDAASELLRSMADSASGAAARVDVLFEVDAD
jgi:hypothetical protein